MFAIRNWEVFALGGGCTFSMGVARGHSVSSLVRGYSLVRGSLLEVPLYLTRSNYMHVEIAILFINDKKVTRISDGHKNEYF